MNTILVGWGETPESCVSEKILASCPEFDKFEVGDRITRSEDSVWGKAGDMATVIGWINHESRYGKKYYMVFQRDGHAPAILSLQKAAWWCKEIKEVVIKKSFCQKIIDWFN